MKRIILLIFSLIIISNFECSAQGDFRDGFIVTLTSDTIYGQIDYRSNDQNYKSCIFQKDNNIIEYSVQQIIGFGYINDKFFISKIIENSFVEALVVGEISLYKFKSIFLIRKNIGDIHRLESGEKIESFVDGKQVLRENTRWKGIISYLISDCFPNSLNIIKNLSLNEKSLTQLVIKYNKCKQSDYIDFKESKPWSKFDLGVSVGIMSSSLKINKEYNLFSHLDDSYNSINPTFGLVLNFSFPRISEKISIQPEFYLTKTSYSSLIKLGESPTRFFYDTYIDITTLSIPISFKYALAMKKNPISIHAGIIYDYNFKKNTKLQSEYVLNNIVTTLPESKAFEINNSLLGLWGSIGISKLFKQFNASANIRYYYLAKMNKTAGFTANLNRVSLSIIIYKK